jgi:hypothetical protein
VGEHNRKEKVASYRSRGRKQGAGKGEGEHEEAGGWREDGGLHFEPTLTTTEGICLAFVG